MEGDPAIMTIDHGELVSLLRLADARFVSPALFSSGGPLATKMGGDGNDFLEFTAYRNGDDARAVDWRASAKCGVPMVRRNRTRASGRWSILVDCSASMRFGSRWDCAVDLASAFAAILLYQSHRVGLVLFDVEVCQSVPPRSGLLHLEEITAALAKTLPDPKRRTGSVISALEVLVRPSGIVVLSDLFWDDDMVAALRACGRIGGTAHVLRLAAREDTEIPARAAGVMDAESGLRRMLKGPSSRNSAIARRNLANLEARAVQACRDAGAVYSKVAVEDGWKTAMLHHLGRAARFRV